MTETISLREVSNRWYGGLTEGSYQNTHEDFREFLEQEVLIGMSLEERQVSLGGLRRWIPDHAATIDSM